MSVLEIVGIVAASTTIASTILAALWKWSKAVEDRAYERARNEALLREAQATISQKDSELDTVKAQRDAALIEQTRLHGVIASLQGTINWITEGSA